MEDIEEKSIVCYYRGIPCISFTTLRSVALLSDPPKFLDVGYRVVSSVTGRDYFVSIDDRKWLTFGNKTNLFDI